MYRNLPRKLTGRERVDRQAFNNLVDAVRVLYNIRAGGGVRVNVDSSGITIVGTRRRLQRRIGVADEGVLVRLKKVSGSAGGPTTQCSFGYDVYPASGPMTDGSGETEDTRLAQDRQPQEGRMAIGLYVFATEGSHGLARRDLDDPEAWVLLYAYDEVRNPGPCDGS